MAVLRLVKSLPSLRVSLLLPEELAGREAGQKALEQAVAELRKAQAQAHPPNR